jgi:hypothetical protein
MLRFDNSYFLLHPTPSGSLPHFLQRHFRAAPLVAQLRGNDEFNNLDGHLWVDRRFAGVEELGDLSHESIVYAAAGDVVGGRGVKVLGRSATGAGDGGCARSSCSSFGWWQSGLTPDRAG